MLLVVLIWGANFSVVKVALTYISPLAFVALRFAIASVVLGGVLWRREGTLLPPRGNWVRLVLLGIIGNTVYQVLFVLSLAYTTAANSSLLIAATPALVALFGAWLGIEKLTRAIAGGVVLALAGVALVVVARGVEVSSDTFTGDMLSLLAALCWAFYTLGVRTLGAGLSPLSITTLTTIIALPGLLLVGGPELAQVHWQAIDALGWLGIAYSSLLAIVLAYLLWNTSVRKVGSNRTAIFGCAIPLVATLVAWPVLGEQPVLLQGIGALLIIGGVLLTRRA
nr:EamA-like transporter family [uncultured bacterium]